VHLRDLGCKIVRLLDRHSRTQQALVLTLGLGAFAVVIWSSIAAHRESFDIQLIMGATRAFLHHVDPYEAWLDYKRGLGPDPGFEAQYPPSVYVILLPLLSVPGPVLKMLLAAANVAAGIGIVAVLKQSYLPQLSRAQTVILISTFLASTPFQTEIRMGQISALAVLAFLLALDAIKRGQSYAAIALLTVALGKYTLTLPLAFVLLNQKGAAFLAIAGAIHILLSIAAAWWLGLDPITLIGHLKDANSYTLFNGYINYSNILSTFGDLGGLIGQFLSVAIAFSACGLMLARRRRDELLSLALLAMVSALCVYHASYDMIIFIFPLGYLIRTLSAIPARHQDKLTLLAIVCLGLSIGLLWFVIEPADWLLTAFAVQTLGSHRFSDPHVVELWYLLMMSLTLSLGLLFALAMRDSQAAGLHP
jgi:hypothetical protein